jgi:hypothetical protein
MTNSVPRVSRCSQQHITKGGSYKQTTVSNSHGWSHSAERRPGPHDRQRRSLPAKKLTQNWEENLPSTKRFTTVFPGAVQDNNTGLVWEQAPDPNWANAFAGGGGPIWGNALTYCVTKTVGGTLGWRLPSVVELMSVQDPSLQYPKVPDSVFTGVVGSYWSAATTTAPNTSAWVVGMNGNTTADAKDFPHSNAWCVRGPMQESVY